MSIDSTSYRARIGCFLNVRCLIVNNIVSCKLTQCFSWFIILSSLLIIGGVELNPGPENNITLEDVWKKLENLDYMRQDISEIKNSFTQISQEICEVQKVTHSLKERITNLEEENGFLLSKLDSLENHSRRSNLLFFNVKEQFNELPERTEHIVMKIINEIMRVDLGPLDIERAHRLGKNRGRDRPIIVKFLSYKKRLEVLQAKRNLYRTNINISEDYTERIRKIREKLKMYEERARKDGHSSSIRFDKLIIDGKYYTLEEIEEIDRMNGMERNEFPKKRHRESSRTVSKSPPGVQEPRREQTSQALLVFPENAALKYPEEGIQEPVRVVNVRKSSGENKRRAGVSREDRLAADFPALEPAEKRRALISSEGVQASSASEEQRQASRVVPGSSGTQSNQGRDIREWIVRGRLTRSKEKLARDSDNNGDGEEGL